MKLKPFVWLAAAPVLAWSAFAAVPSTGTVTAPTTNTTTIMASSVLAPGRYVSSLFPNMSASMADRIDRQLAKIVGIVDIKTDLGTSTIHYTVAEGSHVVISDVQRSVAKSSPGTVLSWPVLEHTQVVHPGL